MFKTQSTNTEQSAGQLQALEQLKRKKSSPRTQQQTEREGRQFALVPLSVLQSRKLTNGQKLAYVYMAAFADEQGFTFAKPVRISETFPIDQPCLSRAKSALRRTGFLFEGKGQFGSGSYLLDPKEDRGQNSQTLPL